MAASGASFWLEFAKLVGADLIGAAATQFFVWWREASKDGASRERDARYLALRLAVILERFAIDCADILGDARMHQSSTGAAGKLHSVLPEMGDYPTDADWKAIDGGLAARALSMRNERVLAIRQLSGTAQFVGAEELAELSEELAGFHGFRAWILARDMRHKHDLPAFDPMDFSHDFVASVRERWDAHVKEKQSERGAERQAAAATT